MTDSAGGRPERAHPAWSALTQLAGLLSAFIALVYLGGAVVFWLRLNTLGLPADSVISYLPREFLISVGVREVLLPLLVLTALLLLLFALALPVRGKVTVHERSRDAVSRWPSYFTFRFYSYANAIVAIGLGALVLVGFLELPRFLAYLLFYSAGFYLMLFPLGRWYGRKRADWSPTAGLVIWALICGTLMLPLAVMYANWRWKPQEAFVCTTAGLEMEGELIGSTGDVIYIGQTRPSREEAQRYDELGLDPEIAPRVVALNASEVTHFYFGENLTFFLLDHPDPCGDGTSRQDGTSVRGSQ